MKNSIQAKVNQYLQLDFIDDDSLWISSSYTLRKVIGILGMLLPLLLWAMILWYNNIIYPLPSISHYYFTHASSIFVITLSLLAVFLIIYKGKEPVDFYFSLFAGIFAMCVVLFPTNNLVCESCTSTNNCVVTTWKEQLFREKIHFISAGLFLLCLAVMSFFLFTKSKLKGKERGPKKRLRNIIYQGCGVLIVLAILVAFLGNVYYPDWCHKSSFIFWMEFVAVESFGFSWMVKGDSFACFRDKDENLVQFTQIQHVGIPVADLETSKTFYKGLGFKEVMGTTFIHHGDEGKVAMMKRGSVTIEIYQMPEPELTEIKNRKNGHIDHIAFDVKEIDKVYATLKAHNYKIIEPGPVLLPFWENGCKYFNIEGPDGERLEFNEIL